MAKTWDSTSSVKCVKIPSHVVVIFGIGFGIDVVT